MRSLLLTALFAAAAGLLLCDCQKKREPVPGPQSVTPQTAPAAPASKAPPATPGGHAGTDRLLRF
jgi:hypothetical protein